MNCVLDRVYTATGVSPKYFDQLTHPDTYFLLWSPQHLGLASGDELRLGSCRPYDTFPNDELNGILLCSDQHTRHYSSSTEPVSVVSFDSGRHLSYATLDTSREVAGSHEGNRFTEFLTPGPKLA